MAELSPALQDAIRRAVSRFHPHNPHPNWDTAEWIVELFHEGILAALQAEHRFDPTVGTKLEDFVYNCVCVHLKTFTNREWSYQKKVAAFPEDVETGEVWEPVDEQSETSYRFPLRTRGTEFFYPRSRVAIREILQNAPKARRFWEPFRAVGSIIEYHRITVRRMML